MESNKIKVVLGLCEGRHDMPSCVEGYVFPECLEVDFTADGLCNLNSMAYRRMKKYEGCKVDLYVTGLSAALAAVIIACRDFRIPLTLFHYNRDTGEYAPQEM